MSRFAQLEDGTKLEFPDDTSDEVMNQTVKKHLGIDSSSGPPQFLKDTAGTIMAGIDLVGSTPGLVGAGTAALVHKASGGDTGRTFPETFNEIMGSANQGNLAEALPDATLAYRNTPGYKATMDVAHAPFQGLGNIAAAGTEALGGTDEQAATAGEYTDVGAQTALMVSGLRGKNVPRLERPDLIKSAQTPAEVQKARASYPPDQPIKPGPTGEQGELFQNEQVIPPSMEGQPNRSPYNLPPEEIARLQEELNPPTEQRQNAQGELYTDFNPVDKFKIEEGPGGGRNKLLDMSNQVTSDLNTTKGLGGATEQSNMEQGLFQSRVPSGEPSTIPWEPPNPNRGNFRQGGGINPEVFKDIVRLVKKIPDSLDHAEELLRGRIGQAMDQRDTVMRGAYEATLNDVHREQMVKEGILRPISDSSKAMEVYRATKEGTKVQLGEWVTPDEFIAREVYSKGKDGQQSRPVIKDALPAKDLYEVHPGGLVYAPKGTDLTRVIRNIDMKTGQPVTLGDLVPKSFTEPRLNKQRGGLLIEPLEREVIRQAKEGNQKAITTLYNNNFPRIVKVVERMVKDSGEAEDVAQGVMIKAMNKLHEFQGQSKFSTWLYRIAVNDAKNAIQARAARGGPGVELTEDQLAKFEPAHGDTPEEALSNKEQLQKIDDAFEKIPPYIRQVLDMKEIQGMSMKEISEQTGMSLSLVKKRLSQARDILTNNVEGLSRTSVAKYQRGFIDFGLQAAVQHAFDSMKNYFGKGKGDPVSQMVSASKDERPWEQVKQENPELLKLPDIDYGMGTWIQTNWTSGNFMAALTRNPIIKWSTDKATQIVRELDWKANQVKYGGNIAPSKINLTRMKLIKDPDAAMTLLKEVLNPKEQSAFSVVSAEFDKLKREPTEYELKSRGMSDTAIRAYQNLRKGLDKGIQEYNAEAKLAGKNPIQTYPGFAPAMRKGSFKVDVLGEDGKSVYSEMTDWMGLKIGSLKGGGAYKLQKALQKQFPDRTVEVTELNTPHDNNRATINTLPFQQALDSGLIDKNSPEAAQIKQFMQELRSRGSKFGSHGLEKRYVEGQMGYSRFKTEKQNNRDFVEAHEKYFDEMYKSIANMRVERELGKFLDDPNVKAKNLKTFVNDFKDAVQGKYDVGNTQAMEDLIVSHLLGTSELGFGVSGARTLVSGLSKFSIMMFMGFWRPASLLTQIIQPSQFSAQMLNHYKTEGYDASVTRAVLKGDMELINMSDEFKTFLHDYALPYNVIDPQMIHAFDLLSVGQTTRTREIARWITGGRPLEAVEAYGRLKTATQAFHFLKEAGVEGRDLYTGIHTIVDNTMLEYTNIGRPHIYKKFGIAGAMMSPLSTFHHGFLAQTLLYVKDLSKFREQGFGAVQPIAIHLANMAFFAGLSGMILVQEADAVVDLLKFMKVLPADFKTISAHILSSPKINDAMAFGPLSSATGIDLSSPLGAPTNQSGKGWEGKMPGMALAMDIGEKTIVPEIRQLQFEIEKFAQGLGMKNFSLGAVPPSRAERVTALKTVLPGAFAGAQEKFQVDPNSLTTNTQKNGLYLDPAHRELGATQRGSAEWNARYAGFHTTKERREMNATNIMQQQTSAEGKSKQQFIDLATDIVSGERGGPPMGQLAIKAADYGMNPDQFIRSLEQNVMNKHFEKSARAYGITPDTLAKYHKYQMLEEMMKNGRQQ